MIDFIPIQYYSYIYYNIILLFSFITLIKTLFYSGDNEITFVYSKYLGIILFWFILLYMGLRPVSYYFGDMGTYAKAFDIYVKGEELASKGDVLFYLLMEAISNFQSKTLFFFIIAFIYILSIYIAVKRLFPNKYYFAFLILIASFEFWSYGTNGIRNGLATSIVLLALTFMNNKTIMYILFFIAFNIHSSVLIPIVAYFTTSIYKSSTIYFKIWFLSIFLSLFIGNSIENFIISLGILREDLVTAYFRNKDLYASSFAYNGFRWDFLAYSSTAVISSYYFIFIKKIDDIYYNQLVNIYLLSNTVWILVIEASFSNRFAYLSWFMMGLIIIYPLLKHTIWYNQFRKIGMIILLYFLFTYLMKFILPNL